jgi:prepilin-type N-terminal cleavage/methylation domain-containing protein
MLRRQNTTTQRRRQPQLRGFTLIELMVVISIVAMLIALLMPALSKARSQGRIIKCQTQMKQAYMGMELYYADHRDPKWTIPASPWDRMNMTTTIPRSWELHHRYSPSDNRAPNGFGYIVRGNYVGNGDILYCPDVSERQRQPGYTPVILNGEPASAADYRNGATSGKTTFLYRLTVNHDGKYMPATHHTTTYNNSNYQWVAREQNARTKRAIFTDLGMSFYGGMYSHGFKYLNATYFDGSIVAVRDGYASNCDINFPKVDAAYGGRQ